MNGATLPEQIILRILQEGPKPFDTILQLSHSLFPDELLTLLTRMKMEGVLYHKGGKYSINDSLVRQWRETVKKWPENLKLANKVLLLIRQNIHLPHALDYEWWFMSSSREQLAYKLILENLLPLPRSVAFLGSPLFGAFVSIMLPDTEISILDKSSASLEIISQFVHGTNLHLYEYDGEDPMPTELLGKAQMVFLDPPWYVEYYSTFFRRCLWLTYSQIATVGTILFPVLTRPSSQQERNQVLTSATECGFQLVGLYPQIVQYETPYFEHEALKTKDISVRDWRHADLALFVSSGQLLPENIYCNLEIHKWKEVIIGKMKVKVKVKRNESISEYIPPSILSVHGTGAVIQSVSRRDPFRDQIDLWTSTHIGLQIQGWRAIFRIVEGLANESGIEQIASLIHLDNSDHPGITTEKIKLDIEPVRQELLSILGFQEEHNCG